jgi:hypothetical protein
MAGAVFRGLGFHGSNPTPSARVLARSCRTRWIDDASALIPSRDASYARTLIGYYLDNYLRHPTERVRSFCTVP